jgi:hypothetical protein
MLNKVGSPELLEKKGAPGPRLLPERPPRRSTEQHLAALPFREREAKHCLCTLSLMAQAGGFWEAVLDAFASIGL